MKEGEMPDDDNDNKEAADAAAAAAAAEAAAAEAAAKAAAEAAGDDDAFDKERAMATITKLREAEKEGKRAARALAEAEAKLKEIEDAKLSEQDKLAKRAEEAEAKVAAAEAKLRHANLLVELAKPEHGIVNAAAAAKLIDGVEYTTDGEPANLTDILPKFLDDNAFLKTAGGQTGGQRGGTNSGEGSGNTAAPALTAEELDAAKRLNMKPEDYKRMQGIRSLEDWQAARAADSKQ